MADPVTLAVVGATTAMAGAGVSAMGSMYAGEAQRNAYQYQAGVAEQNRKYELALGEVQAQREGMAGRYKLGEIVSRQAGSGFDVTRGTARAVQSSQQDITQFNEAQIRNAAARRAYGYDVEQRLDLVASKNVMVEAQYGALSSILGGVSSATTKFAQAGPAFGSPFSFQG